MTRRIALSILLVVWLALLTAGTSTYFITRSVLVADLDETIIWRVASLSQVERPAQLPNFTPDARDRFYIQGPTGSVTSMSPPLPSPSAGTPSNLQPALKPDIVTGTFVRLADGSWWRTLTLRAYARHDNPAEPLQRVTVVYSAPADHLHGLLTDLLWVLGGFGVMAALATGLAAKSVAEATMRPLRDATAVLGAIDERTLSSRLDVEKLPPELIPMGLRLNDMLGRLENAFTQRKRFLADASHELRTPVAGLVTTLEVSLRRPREAREYAQAMERCLSDARQLHELVVALIEQARSERFAGTPEFVPVPVISVLQRCVDIMAPLAKEKQVRLTADLPADGAHMFVLTDEQMVRSMVLNLLSNAVEYSPAGGDVALSASLHHYEVESLPEVLAAAAHGTEGITALPKLLTIRVRDRGPGISAADLSHIFEPFYRADSARAVTAAKTTVAEDRKARGIGEPGPISTTADSGIGVAAEGDGGVKGMAPGASRNHLGLGLAMVRSNVLALGGECRVSSPPAPGETGCLFTIELPTVEVGSENVVSGPRESIEDKTISKERATFRVGQEIA